MKKKTPSERTAARLRARAYGAPREIHIDIGSHNVRRNPVKRARSGMFQATMRTDPLSQNERALARRLREMEPERLEKMIPKWARSAKFPKHRAFVPGAAPVYPAWAASTTLPAETRKFPQPIDGESAKEYARRFYELNNLVLKNPSGVRIVHNRLRASQAARDSRISYKRAGYQSNPGASARYTRLTGQKTGRVYAMFRADQWTVATLKRAAKYLARKHREPIAASVVKL